MSISDLIIVMKEGVVHQIGKPQDVYDDPVNLFVATFLGTPPINVFEGRVEGGKLCIGSESVLSVRGVADREVTVAIRPEGFELTEAGRFTCALNRVEVMGRDISVVCRHEAFTGTSLRAIIRSENLTQLNASAARFDLLPHKVFLFAKEDGSRICFDAT